MDTIQNTFRPVPRDLRIEYDDEMISLLVEAGSKVALLNGIAERIPTVQSIANLLVKKEALA